MEQMQRTVLLFGDYTEPWTDSIDSLSEQADSIPWLQSFLNDVVLLIKDHRKDLEPFLQASLGHFTDLQDLADRWRHTEDELGFVQVLMLYTVRAAFLLQWVKRENVLDNAEILGISGGLVNASVLAVARDFDTLYEACLEVFSLFYRSCRLAIVRSRAIEDGPGSWGRVVVGISASDLRNALDRFQSNMVSKRAKIGLTGDKWSTVIGPPSVLELFFRQCPAVSTLAMDEANIHALQHTLDLSETDLDYILGESPFHNSPVYPGFKLWGMDEPEAEYKTWGHLLRAMILQALALPLDIVQAVGKVTHSFASCRQVIVKNMGLKGPSSHATYLVSALKASGGEVTFQNGMNGRETESPTRDRIAIVGMAGQGPGCGNVEELWNVILNAQDLHQEIPKDRFDLEQYLQPGHATECASASMSKYGCFMKEPGNFDARFFHISPREAVLMEPGHRLFLMSAYEALETAGYSNGQTTVTDSNRISIFFGQCNDDWRISSHDVKGCDSYTLPGTQRAFGPGRLAFHFGWEGPTYCLDSACSSSCSSINLACMSLLSKDTDMAVAGAANVIGYPHSWIALSQSGVLSPTGNCKPFRDDADGYCRADFVGAVVLKRLKDAIAHNDNILAVIAGRDYSVRFSEMHGHPRMTFRTLKCTEPGHRLGTDPAEMGAVARTFRHRQKEDPLTVGAVKGNLGHSESAAGMASLLKCILMFQKDVLPPQAGMPHALNPRFPSLSDINVVIPSQSREFKANPASPRRILLNNFDAAGGNGCLLLEDYGSSTTPITYEDPRACHVIVSSAKTSFSYSANKQNLLNWIRANPQATIQDIAYTTTARRTHWPIRYACTASTKQDLITKLESSVAHASSDAPTVRKAPVVFVFTGQGSDYAGMGAELYLTNPVFRGTVDLCVRIAQDHNFPSYIDLITDKAVEKVTRDPVETQLALLTLEISLAAFWKSLGVQPDMVIGHSLGEYAALQIAGVLSLADVVYLVGQRALLLQERCDAGSCTMLAIVASAATVQEHLAAQQHSSCAVACVNGPSATVVSGPAAEVAELQSQLAAHNVRSRILSVPFAFHSLQMDPMLSEFATLARAATYAQPKIPVASTLLASVIGMEGDSNGVDCTFSADYLAHQTRQKVDFVGALGAITSKIDAPIWLEIGPSQVCGSFVQATLSSSKSISTLEADTSDWASISKCLAGLYENGVEVDWLAFHRPYEDRLKLLTIPSYAWDLKNYWIPYTEPKASAHATAVPRYRETVNEGLISTCAQSVMQESISPKIEVTLVAATAEAGFEAFIGGHRLRGVPVCAGAVFMEAALAAGTYLLGYSKRKTASTTSLSLGNMSLNRPITQNNVRSNAELQTTAAMESLEADTMLVSFKVSSSGGSQALGACTLKIFDSGRLEALWDRTSFFIKSRMDELIRSAENGHSHQIQSDIYYALFADTVEYDAPFKGVKKVYVSKDFEEAAAEVLLQNDPPGTKFTVSPYWVDSLTQLAGFVVNGNPKRPRNITFMMASFESYEQTAAVSAGKLYFTYVRVTRREKDTIYCDLFVFDEGKLIIQCSNCIFHEMNNGVLERLLGKSRPVTSVPAPESRQQAPQTAQTQAHEVTKPITVAKEQTTADTNEASQGGIFNALVDSIVKATGGEKSELTDDIAVANIGVDSIMAIEIAADVNENTGSDLLPSFVVEYPTIGHLRLAFGEITPSSNSVVATPSEEASSLTSGSESAHEPPPAPESRVLLPDETSDSMPNGLSASEKEDKALMTAEQLNSTSIAASKSIDDGSPAPRVRISLMQGHPALGKPRFYIIADGSGTIATYIYLPPLKISMPVYGIDSPFLHCPSRLTTEVGIQEVAMHIVEALVKAQPEGPFFLGGFSGGAMLSYEVSRQVAALGRKVDALVLIDMCCPRLKPAPGTAESMWNADVDAYETVSAHAGFSTVASNTQEHLRAMFKAVSAYHPPPMTANERPLRTAVIWAEKGTISRCYDSPELMEKLAKCGLTAESRPGFMEDPSLGSIRWSILNKGPENLGPNGWEKSIGYDPLCSSVKTDHLEMMAPGQVHLLRGALEQAFGYLVSSD
ncbi:MAG: polyketide synthase pks13 [Chrysothrix sp. TS-e1954]|nr:MAG: polyketide synthase pks13 [Chrysothrix sp. TS-e1954]